VNDIESENDLIEHTRHNLHEAIQAHAASFQNIVVTDWAVMSEVVNEEGNPDIVMLCSDHMTAWKLFGLSKMSEKIVGNVTGLSES